MINQIRHNAYKIGVKLDGGNVSMELDTGSGVTLLSDVYPLPTLEDVVNKVGYGETFTKLDLSQAFHQFELDENSHKYTTINTIKGLYQYNRLVFGVPSATEVCQRTMENILKNIPGGVLE